MRPILFSINGFDIPSYYTLISLGIIIGFLFFYKKAKKEINENNLIDIGIIISITSYLGARIFHIIFEEPKFYFENPSLIFNFSQGGYVFYGGVIFSVLAVYIYSKIKKIDFLKITDYLAIGVSLGTAIGRMGCLLQGCCFGKISSFGIYLHGATRHPTQLYLSLNSLVIFIVLMFLFKKQKFKGQITFIYLILYSIGRAIIEFFRADFRGNLFDPYLSTSQFISIIILTISLSLYFYYKNKLKIKK